MNKKFTSILITVSFILFFSLNISAQYTVKPAAIKSELKQTDNNLQKDDRNFEVVWSESFNGELPASWQNENVNGFCAFQHTFSGPQGPFSTGIPAINSTTAPNGFMILDSDLCNIDGEDLGYETVDAYIESPAINLSEYNSVGLRFEHFFRYCCDPSLIEQNVLISNDGENWAEFDVTHNLAPNNLSDNPQITVLNISAIAGGHENVWIRFHIKGATQYFWMIDDVSIVTLTENDLELLDVRHESYTIIPGGIKNDISFAGNVVNAGSNAQNNVNLNVEINDYLFSETSDIIPSLNPSAELLFEIAEPFVFPGKGVYELVFSVNQDQTDELPENNTEDVVITVSDSIYARDFGLYSSGNLVWPALLEISHTGNIFDIETNAFASSVSVALHENTLEGEDISVVLFERSDGDVFSEIARSLTYTITPEDINNAEGEAIWLSIPFETEVELEAGFSYLAAVEYSSNNVAIAAENNVWQAEGVSYSQIDGDWAFENSLPMIRLNFGQNIAECNILAHFDVVDDFCDMGNGSITAFPLSGTPPYTYEWNTDPISEEAKITDLLAGTYTVIITDAESCSEEFIIEVESKDLEYELEIIPAACGGENGVAIVTPVSGQAPFTYSWSHDVGLTDSIATGLLPGSYTMTITDNNGCEILVDIEVESIDAVTLDYEVVQPICLADNGSILIIPINGEAPFDYSWSNDEEFVGDFQDNLVAGIYTVTVTDNNDCVGTIEINLEASDVELLVLGDVIDATCEQANGAVYLNVTNGQDPYEFLWSNQTTDENLVDVHDGNYSVFVTDHFGCTGEASFEINNSGIAPEVTIDVTNASACGEEDGSIVVAPVDPEADYSYEWGGGETGPELLNIGSGFYDLTVTDNAGDCYAYFEITVNDDGLPDMTVNQNNVSCFGYDNGYISVDIDGGDFDFLWNTGSEESFIENLQPGDYNLTLTNANCFAYLEFTITEPDPLEIQDVEILDPSCYDYDNGSIEIQAVGGTEPYQYLWNDQMSGSLISDLSAGIYDVVVTDINSCEIEKSYILNNPEEIVIIAQVVNPDAGEDNGSIDVTVFGGVGEITYDWDSGHSGPNITGLGPGEYTVTVTDENDCSAEETFELFVTSIHDPDFADNISIYPNPAKEFVNVEFGSLSTSQWEIKLFDLRGIEIRNWNVANDSSETKLNLNSLSAGVYVLQIVSDLGKFEQIIVKN